MKRILCWFGLHTWRMREQWTPAINARIVTRYQFWATCARCGKEDYTDWHFDSTPGASVDA